MTLFILAGGLYGQSTVILEGRVADARTGEPIPGATVQKAGSSGGAVTDLEGFFELEGDAGSEVEIVVRSVGYHPVRIPIGDLSDSPVLIELEPEILRSEEVVVTGSPLGRNIHYQPVQSMNREQLQQQAAPSLGEMLDGTVGVATRSFGSAPARPVIRGFDGDRVLVMQNGERMGDLSSTAVDHAVALDPLSMDRVEIIRGPASLLYGSSAIGGVVNMFSSDMPREWEEGFSGTVATHGATMNRMGAGMVRIQQGTENIAATGRLIYRDADDLRTPAGRLPDTRLSNRSYGGGVGFRSGEFESGLSVSGMDYSYGLPDAVDNPLESIEIQMNRFNLQSISTLEMPHFFEHAELRVHYSSYRHDELELLSEPDGSSHQGLGISFDQQTVSSSLVLRHRQIGASEGAVGFSANYSEMDVGGANALTPNASGYFMATYLYEEILMRPGLRMKAGGRVEFKKTSVRANKLFPDASRFEDRRDLIFSGAAGLHYSPSRQWTAGLQIARAYRTPTIEELYSFSPHAAAGSFDVGDSELQNEYSLGSDLYVDYHGALLSSQLSLFANRIDHYVDFAPSGEQHEPSELPIFRYVSRDAILYGFEWMTVVDLNSRWQASAGLDYVRGRERGDSPNDLTFIPPMRTHLQLHYDSGSIRAGARMRIVSRQDRVAPNEAPTDGYPLLGLDAVYRFGHGVSLSFRMDNLMNERYKDHLSRVENRDAPMPGRNLNAMFRWEF
ncbi:MAG: TonB-dependent receptor [Balneolaceae bacterium]